MTGSSEERYGGIYDNKSFVYNVATLLGCNIRLCHRNGNVFEGVFRTFSHTMNIALEMAHKVENKCAIVESPGEIKDNLIFKAEDIVFLSTVNHDTSFAVASKSGEQIEEKDSCSVGSNVKIIDDQDVDTDEAKPVVQETIPGHSEKRYSGIFGNEPFVCNIGSLIGCNIRICLKNGDVFEGLFRTFSKELDVAVEMAHRIEKRGTSSPTAVQDIRDIIFKAKDIVSLSSLSCDTNFASASSCISQTARFEEQKGALSVTENVEEQNDTRPDRIVEDMASHERSLSPDEEYVFIGHESEDIFSHEKEDNLVQEYVFVKHPSEGMISDEGQNSSDQENIAVCHEDIEVSGEFYNQSYDLL